MGSEGLNLPVQIRYNNSKISAGQEGSDSMSQNHIVNLRDIGGVSGLGGRTVKKNVLLRSGELWRLCEEDKRMLRDRYHLGLIADFRKQDEVTERPDDAIEGAVYHHIDVMEEIVGKSTGKYDLEKTAGQQDVDSAMRSLYREIVTDAGARRQYRYFLQLLLENPDGHAALFHCYAGKDRTGLGAALILGILGVSFEDMMWDYLLTNEQRAEENARIIEAEREKGASPEVVAALYKIYGVDASYLEAARDEVMTRWGGFSSYVREGIGFSDEETAAFRKKYLE